MKSLSIILRTVVVFSVLFGVVAFVDRDKQKTRFAEEKAKMAYTIDSLKAEVFYVKMKAEVESATDMYYMIAFAEDYYFDNSSDDKFRQFKFEFVKKFHPNFKEKVQKKAERLYVKENEAALFQEEKMKAIDRYATFISMWSR